MKVERPLSPRKSHKKDLMNSKSWQKQLCSCVLFCFLVTQVTQIDLVFAKPAGGFFADFFAGPADEDEKKVFKQDLPYYDLVAVLVAPDVYNNAKFYEGLNDKYKKLSDTTLKERIIRYAEDVEKELPNTKVSIIEVSEKDTVLDISDVLEKFYFEGDGSKNEENSLAGVILVGDVPIPVVNKSGNRFPSMFPYTDFVDKAYIFNPETQEYEANTSLTAQKAEVWHGVMKQPKEGEEGMNLLAEYFDKNHLYHLGEPEFSEFAEKLFFADLNYQEKVQNKDYFQYYLNYIKNAEDLIYKRFTNKWFQKVSGGVVSEFKEDFGEVLNPELDLAAMQSAISQAPDVFTKDLIEKYHVPYNGLFAKYLSRINDLIEYAGRWDEKETPVGLIAKKDFFTRQYLKKLNDMLEEKVDEIVENDLQDLVPIVDKIVMTGTIDLPDEPNFEVKKTFLNFSRQYYDGDDNALYVNGTPGKMIERVDQCSLYRGSVNDDSQLTYMNRTFDSRTYNVAPIIGFIVKPTNPDQIKAMTGGKFDYGAILYTGYHYKNADKGTIDDSGAADAGGFDNGDIILKVAEEKITPKNSLWDIVTRHIPGEKVPVTYVKKIEKKDALGLFVISVDYVESEPIMVEIKSGKGSGGMPTLAINTISLSPDEALLLTENKYNYGVLVKHDPKTGYPAALPYFDPDSDDKENYGGKHFKEDDIILEIDGRKITGKWTIKDALNGKHIYDVVSALRYRDGATKLIKDIDLVDMRNYIAGCDITNSQNQKPLICSPYAAKIPVFSEGGGSVAFQDSSNEPTPEDCYNLLPYESLKGVRKVDLGDVLDPAGLWEEYDGPDPSYTPGTPNYLKDAAKFYNKLVNKPKDIDWLPNGLPEDMPQVPIINPNAIRIGYKQVIPGQFTGLDTSVDFKKILSHYGRFDREDNDSDYYDTNGNGKKDPMIFQEMNSNTTIDYKDPQTGQIVPIPTDAGGKYTGPYTGEFVGGDWGLDEPDEDQAAYAFPDSFSAFHDKFLRIDKETKWCTPTSLPNSDECGGDVQIFIKFTPTIKKWIPSVIKHKEPTNDTIMAQVESGTAKGLPVDDPRYIAFLLKTKKTEQKVSYPNAFKSESYDDFVSKVHELETKLNGFAALSGNGKNYSGSLVGLLSNPSDPIVSGTAMVKDAISWQNMNVDDKNSYVLQTYLGPEKNGFIAESEKGYEALYLVAQTKDNLSQRSLYLDMDLNGGTPSGDPQFTTVTTSISASEEFDDEDEDSDCDIFTCWFPEFLKWLKTTLTFTGGFEFEQACGLSEDLGDGKDLYEVIADMAKDDDENGIPNGAEGTSKLQITTNKKALKADGKDVLEVKVAAYDFSNKPLQDSYSQVELTILNPPDKEAAKLISPNPSPLVRGEATFIVQSTQQDGNFTLYARTLNRPSNIQSNSVIAKSTNKSLYLSTFITLEDERKFYTQLGTDVFSIKDKEGKEIAKVDDYGNLSIIDPMYGVSVLSSPDEPFGLSVVNKETQESAADLFAVLHAAKVIIDDMSVSYDEISDLYGVHVKDLVPSDSFKVEPVPADCQEFYGDAYILEGTEIKGLVTRKGQVLSDGSLHFEVKDKIKNSYVIEVKADSSDTLIEVFVTPMFRTVNKFIPKGSAPESGEEAFVPKAYAAEGADSEMYSPDTDADGLTDLTEIIIGTSPLKPDSDSDSFTDGAELVSGYSPLQKSAALFSDVSTKHEFFDEILNLYKRGILSGYADHTFKPDNKITREEFVKIDLGVSCTACTGLNPAKKTEILAEYNKKGAFPDMDVNSDLLYCVAEAKNQGIVSGYEGEQNYGYFLPKNFISRAEAIKVIVETANLPLVKSGIAGAPWYADYFLTAQKEGILPKGRFVEFDSFSSEDFVNFYKGLIESGQTSLLQAFLEGVITRGEFAYMASYVLNKFDCYKNDKDEDGIPDFLEIYRFGTDMELKDTDLGGVSDLAEIVRGTDPLNAADDAPLAENVCEVLLEKFGGGEASGEASDEISGLTDGFYVRAKDGAVSEEYVFEETAEGPSNEPESQEGEATGAEPEMVENTEIIEFAEHTNEVLADGESILHTRVEISGEDGKINENDNESVVQFSILDGSGHIDIPFSKVKVKNGIAETDIVSKKSAGFAYIKVELLDQDFPAIERQIYAYPGPPVSIDLVPQSYILKAGGVSKTPVKIILRDKNGNPAINAPYNVTLKVKDGDSKFDAKADTDPNEEGIQITAFSEPPVIDLFSSEKPEVAHLHAEVNIPDEEIFAEGKTLVSVRDDIKLLLTSEKISLVSDSDEKTVIKAEVVDFDNKVVGDFQGRIKFSVSESSLGHFTGDPDQNVVSGKSYAEFAPGKRAGKVFVSALLEGFQTQSFELNILPNKPYKMVLSSPDEIVVASGETAATVTAELYDKNDNFAYNDSKTKVTFAITDATQKFGEFVKAPPLNFTNGKASALLKGKGVTGPINLYVESDGLVPGTLEIPVKTRILGSEIADLNPNVLFVSLLGGPFGDITKSDYLGGLLTFSGRVQAAVSLLANSQLEKPVANIPPNGKITLADSSKYYSLFIPANDATSSNLIVMKDLLTGSPILEARIVPKSVSSIVVTDKDIPNDADDGLYVKKISADPAFTYQDVSDGLSLLYKNGEIARIYQNGNVEVTDPIFAVDYPAKADLSPHFNAKLMRGTENFADLYIVQKDWPSVKMIDEKKSASSLDTGVYLIQRSDALNFSENYSSYSTHAALGYIVTDPSVIMTGPDAPGFSYDSLEDAASHEGVGFRGTNKHMLLFAAGNTVGESNLPFASEIGIVLGDPTVRLKVKSESSFTQDLGSMVYQGDKLMKDLVPIDFDSDGDQDLFVIYEDGEIRLLEKIPTRTRYKDRGVFLNVVNGIYSAVSGDFDSDNDQDLFVSTKDSCKQGEVCMYLYRNNGGFFDRESLDFNITSKMYFMKAGDIDNDSDIDVVGSDTGGKIMAFYNNGTGFDYEVAEVGNLGIQADPTVNLSSNVWVHYSGMIGVPEKRFNPYLGGSEEMQPNGKPKPNETIQRKLDLNLTEGSADTSRDDVISAADHFGKQENIDNAKSTAEIEFNLLSEDSLVSKGSYKKLEDVNGGNVEIGDELLTTIFVKNNSSAKLNNVFVNDLGSSMFEIQKNTVQCAECENPVQIINSGLQPRPLVFIVTSLPPQKTATITYKSIVKEVPKVQINLVKESSHFSKDEYLDVQARPEDNPTGQIVYYHTDPAKIFDENKRVIYHFFKTPKPQISQQQQEEQAAPLSSRILEMAKDSLSARSADFDKDGLPDSWDDFNYIDPDVAAAQQAQKDENGEDKKSLNELADLQKGLASFGEQAVMIVESAMSFLKCSGGCLPIPINYAFLVPGSNSAMQWVLTPIPPIALPVFTLITSVPGFAPFYSGPSYFRLYISPTITAGLGIAMCFGTVLLGAQNPSGGFCFAVAPPIAKMLGGNCDILSDAISDAASSVAGAVESSASSGFTVVQANGSQFGADVAGPEDDEATSFGGSQVLGNYPVSASGSVNVRIPPFPSVIVEWIDRQIENIFDRLTDLPDIYFIYPDMDYISKEFDASMQGFQKMKSSLDFITALNRFPLISLQTEEVTLKIPTLTPQEIQKVQNDWRQWQVDFDEELKRVKDLWGCDPKNKGKKENEDLCQKVFNKLFVDGTKLIQAVEKNMDAMDEWMMFPKKVLTWRYLEAKYIRQIICYMDVIITWFQGWMKKQQKRVKSWLIAIEKIKKNIETWKAVIDLTLNYETSCDECKTDRFSQLELLMKIFAVIPPPPNIPLPKWPNIVLDFSKLQIGLKFMLPDMKFRPAKIIIPPIPRIRLPDIIPNVQLILPEIPVIPGPPKLPELPDLPPVPIVKLPDIPKAPSVPKLPDVVVKLTGILEVILKILCLLKKGFIPIPENSLKTQIETLTQRGLGPLSPFDLGFKVDYPEMSYSYVDQIKLTTTVNFQLDLDPIMKLVKILAGEWNDSVDSGVKKFNDELKDFAKGLENIVSPDIPKLDLNYDMEMFNGVRDYFEEMRQTIETFKQENNIEGDELRLLARTESYMPPETLACNIDNVQLNEVPAMKEKLKSIALDIKENGAVSRLFAATKPPESNDEAVAIMDDAGEKAPNVSIQPENATPVLRGLFIVNPKEGINGKLISYTEELDFPSHIRYVDIDGDTDQDIIFTLDSNIYLKENLKLAPKIKYYKKVASDSSVSDFLPNSPSVNMFTPSAETNKSADVSFMPAYDPNLYGYEFILKNSSGTKKVNMVMEESNKISVYSFGDASLSSFMRHTTSSGSVHAKPGSLIHALEDSVLVMHYDSETSEEVEMKKHDVLTVADSYVDGIQVEVFDGSIEVIDPEERVSNQKVSDGMLLLYDDEFKVESGEIIVKYPQGAETVVESGESFSLMKLAGPKTGTHNFVLENGNYYASIYSFNKQGKRSTKSNPVLLAPQICGDKTPPFPLADATERTELILKEFTISAGGSFDTDSEITSYGLDLDSDGTIDMFASPSDPVFKLGPFEKPRKFDAKLIVTDEANNQAALDIAINIVVPNITLDQTVSEKGFITGAIDVKEPNIPIKIVRKRGEGIELLKTVSAGEKGEYLTDSYGSFRVEDLDLENKIVLKDSEGAIIGEIYPNISLKEDYEYVAYPAPTHVEARDKDGNVLLSFFFVSDPNNDVQIDGPDTAYTKDFVYNMSGAHIRDVDSKDTYEIVKVPTDIEEFSGGAVLMDVSAEKEIAALDTAGNIYLLDENAKLSVRKATEDDPFVFEISYDEKIPAEVYVPAQSGLSKLPETSMQGAIKKPEFLLNKLEFKDVPKNHPQFDIIQKLRGLGIIQGYDSDSGLSFKPEQNITRAEFAKIILKVLCIYPRETSFLPPSFFSDIFYKTKDDPWYFSILKETSFQGFITGYLGEKDPVTGLPPFKPNNNITRAEATKIVLEALNKIGVIDLPKDIKFGEGEAWYDPYLRIAINLKPYGKTKGLLKTSYLLLASESLMPNKVLTRAELAELAGRVLDAYNCYESDMDGDSIIDDLENKYGFDPKDPEDANLDYDGDKLLNAEEIEIGTDPYDPDTDDGGVSDFDEVQNKTNPVDDPSDDNADVKQELSDISANLKEGTYVDLPACNSCPCSSNICNSSDMLPEDTIFAIISNDDNSEIYSKSNEIQILKVEKHVQ